MKSVTVFITGMIISSSVLQNDINAAEEKAYWLISKVVEEFMAPDSAPPESSLTEAEKEAVGRYLEAPKLEEIYPGIGRAIAFSESS